MAPELTLYQFASCPFCARVRKTLAELGLTYEAVTLDPAAKVQIDGIGDTTVPVLRDGEVVMKESGDIVAYLQSTYGAGAP